MIIVYSDFAEYYNPFSSVHVFLFTFILGFATINSVR